MNMENKQLFQAPATIQGVSTLKDRTLKLTSYVSRELPPEDMAKLFELEGKEGWLLFSPNILQVGDVPLQDAPVEKIGKSPTERLYNVMFVFYMQNNKDSSGFKVWREAQMEKIIMQFKDKLV